jgi:hypothetical protein
VTHLHTPGDPRIFVFGSNLRGIHGAGAALYARKRLGALNGCGEGMMGRSYALPTCISPGVPLHLSGVFRSVEGFLAHAGRTPDIRYFVSTVGCGLAGFTEDEIAPLFAGAPDNCDLPPGWRR